MNHVPPDRPLLRNLCVSQKLLVAVILCTIGLGYAGALINLFAQQSVADGKAAIKLDDVPRVLAEKGFGEVLRQVRESLGLADVVRVYHGTGDQTRLEAALNGTMRDMVLEGLAGKDEPADADTQKLAEELRRDLIAFSRLPVEQRRLAYEKGAPGNDSGTVDWANFAEAAPTAIAKRQAAAAKKRGGKSTEQAENAREGPPDWQRIIKETLDQYCVKCHGPTGIDAQARSLPLGDFAAVDDYCVPDRGMSYKQLAMTTHVHLLGFSVLFALTGFLFSLTSYPAILRVVFTPWTLFFQLAEVCCWWLAKSHILFAHAIYYLGPIIGLGVAVQIVATLLDLLLRRPTR